MSNKKCLLAVVFVLSLIYLKFCVKSNAKQVSNLWPASTLLSSFNRNGFKMHLKYLSGIQMTII